MTWWVWALLAWPVASVVVGLGLGRMIKVGQSNGNGWDLEPVPVPVAVMDAAVEAVAEVVDTVVDTVVDAVDTVVDAVKDAVSPSPVVAASV